MERRVQTEGDITDIWKKGERLQMEIKYRESECKESGMEIRKKKEERTLK